MKFKKFLIGLAIFIVTIVFIVFANKAINPEPKYPNCSRGYNYNYYDNGNYGTLDDSSYTTCQNAYTNDLKNYNEKAFFIITVLSLLAIIAGVLVRSVMPVSWGLGLAGLAMIMYVFIANFEEIGKPYRAIVSGIALVVLIWLAYAKLGDKEKINEQVSPTVPPVIPSSPSSVPPAVPPSSMPPIN